MYVCMYVCMYVLVKAWPSAIPKIKHEARGRDANKVQGEAECFILCMARARPCFNCFKELTHECLIKAYPFQITCPLTSSSRVRRFWTISYANNC